MVSFEENVDLYPYNTFHISVRARNLARVHSRDELIELLQTPIFQNTRHLILGGGSNILFTGDFDGIVIKNEITGIATEKEDDDHIVLRSGSGENWHELVMFCVKKGWGGIENLSLIPGTVGAAPMQNIGAYGVEIKETLVSVEAVELATGRLRTFDREECQFGYRESIFKRSLKDQYFITAVILRLTKRNHNLNVSYGTIQEVLRSNHVHTPTIQAVSEAVVAIRRSKLPDPAVIGNAGSFFKNPSIEPEKVDFIKKEYPSIPTFPGENGLIKIPAAWLIEQCGWKGKTFNNIGVHKNQALVLVNYGDGKGEELWKLAAEIRESVMSKFNIDLHPEVNIVS